MKKQQKTSAHAFVLRIALALALTSVSAILLASTLRPPAAEPEPDRPAPDVVALAGPVSQDLDLRALRYVAPTSEEEEIPRRRHPFPLAGGQIQQSSFTQELIQRVLTPIPNMPAPILTFAGMNSTQSGCGCLPPDSDGDVGPNHYVNSVNSSIKIFDRLGNALNGANGTTYNSFFSALGTGNPCGNNKNDGDGIVFYDHMADRWVVSDFAFAGFPGSGPFMQCIGVSKTSDPVSGGWWLYAIQVDPANPTFLGDYPKFGLWPDAYYLSMNEFSNNTTFNGVRVYALDRNSMVNGGSANAIGFSILPADLGDQYSLVPASFRTGNPPPAGQPEWLMDVNSSSVAGTVETQVFVRRFHVDFGTPANSVFGVGATHSPDGIITVNGFKDAFTTTTSNLCPNGSVTTGQWLDTLGDKIMYPLIYQNRGGIESIYGVQTVAPSNNGTTNSGPTAVRWYQFNMTGNTIPSTPAQQQDWTNGNDGLFRWMPSINVDRQGNVAIGYSTSSTTLNPEIRYAGRLAGDPPNNMSQGEATLITSGGHQTSTSGRWGDYSTMFVDPTDNCTFWHVNEYYTATSSASWATRIGSFKFPDCAAAPTPTATPTATAIATATATFTPTATATFTPTATATFTPTATATATFTPTATATSTPTATATFTPTTTATFTPTATATFTPTATATFTPTATATAIFTPTATATSTPTATATFTPTATATFTPTATATFTPTATATFTPTATATATFTPTATATSTPTATATFTPTATATFTPTATATFTPTATATFTPTATATATFTPTATATSTPTATATFTPTATATFTPTATATAAFTPTPTPPSGNTNVALQANGGVASASASFNSNYGPSGVNNGDRRGLNWGNGGGWNSPLGLPQWLEVDFNNTYVLNEIDVFTVQDNYLSPSDPTLNMTFTLFGATGFEVQYWNGTQWTDIPGGNVTGNNRVWRQFALSPTINTNKIRILINVSADNYARLVEVEAWATAGASPSPTAAATATPTATATFTPTPTPPSGNTNVALQANGGVASASASFNSNYGPSGVNNGDRRGLNWGNGGGWNSPLGLPQWLEVDFNNTYVLNEIDVFTVQDNYLSPSDPTLNMTFTLFGATGFEVQYWNGTQWTDIPGGNVTGNNRVWRQFALSPTINTNKIRILINVSADNYARLVEVEAWATAGASPSPTAAATATPTATATFTPTPTPPSGNTNVALQANGGVASASASFNSNYGPSGVNNGDRRGLNWGNGGGWNSPLGLPQWLEVDFNNTYVLNEIDVFTVQDNYLSPSDPTLNMTFTLFGATGFEVQYWNGTQWTDIPSGNVTGNNRVWRQFALSPTINTNKIRILINVSPDNYARLVEVEAWAP